MRARAKILIVEDDPDVVVFMADNLSYLGFRVLIARNGVEGLEKVAREKPDLVILDVMMPEMDGHEVCRRLKGDSLTQHIPILMLTAKGQLRDKVQGFDIGADDYMAKPYEKAEFEARVKALLKRLISPRFASSQSDCIFSVSCTPGYPINIRTSGVVAFGGITKGLFNIDADAYARHGENTPLLDWSFNSKEWGKNLYNEIFNNHREVLSNYKQTLGEVGEDERLHLRFECSQDGPRIPLEFLFDDIDQTAGYLVLRHPLARFVTKARIKRQPVCPAFLNDLWSHGDDLKILLIASNTTPAIPGADQEIRELSGSLEEIFEGRGISAQVHTIPTEQASYERVRGLLQRCSYHIVHYAGHGAFDGGAPQRACLFFWEKENRQGVRKPMAIHELSMLLKNSDVRFAYMSCCFSTSTAKREKLLDNQCLGIADGVIQAGIPSVLGFRWTVSDDGAKTLATSFYQSLAKQGQIDTALLAARRHTASRDPEDITWMSPVLTLQA